MRKAFLFVLLVAIVVFFLSGCGKSECSVDTDCSASGACLQASCVEGICKTTPKADCCGNARCEATAGENACSCPLDCKLENSATGKCEGKLKVPNQYRPQIMEDAEYAQYYCNADDECVIGVPDDLVQEKQFFSESKTGYVNFQTVAVISKPYVLDQGEFTYQITFSDIELGRARVPVKITNVQVLFRDELVGQQTVDETFTAVGDVAAGTIRLAPSLDSLEEKKTLTFKVNYEYQAVSYEFVSGQRVDVLTTDRQSFTTSFDDLLFINPKVN